MNRANTNGATTTGVDASLPLEQAVLILERIRDGFFAVDREWCITYVNPGGARLLQSSPQELTGRNLWDAFPQAVGTEFDAQYHRALADQVPVAFEAYYEPLGAWFEVHAYPSPEGLSVYFQDVSERKRGEAERERLAAEAHEYAVRLRAIIDSMADAVFVVDTQGRITLANDANEAVLGLGKHELQQAASELPAQLAMRRTDGTPITSDEMPIKEALAGKVVGPSDIIIYNRSRQRDTYMRFAVSPIRDSGGQVIGAVTTGRDVTESVEIDRMKDQFIAVAAHELKTPVTVMKGYAQVLLRMRTDAPGKWRKMLEAIDRGADRMDRIINDLLNASQLQTGRLPLSMGEVSLEPFVAEAIQRAASAAPRHRIRLIHAEPLVVCGDPRWLAQVLASLIDNAIKYSPEGGDIDLAIRKEDGEAVVSVRDYGVGIPRERQAGIFQRFYRAHTGTPYDYGGLGIGLYLSHEIIRQHHGRMWFESAEGQGSTFFFSLPLAS